jgi:hypothetical protein
MFHLRGSMRRARAAWAVLRAWLRRLRRKGGEAAPIHVAPPSTEIKNPLRLDDEEYLRVMKELDDVLSPPGKPEHSSL